MNIYQFCHAVINHRFFEPVVLVVIILNTAFLATEYHGMSSTHREVLFYAEIVFVCLFVIEFILKVIGLGGFRKYWEQPMNRFDFTILLISIVGLFTVSLSSLRALRLLRPLRILRVMALHGQLRQLINTVLGSVNAILNILVFILMALLVFSIMAMDLFGGEVKDSSGRTPRQNFNNFPVAILTLFEVMTGENWPNPMFDAMNTNEFNEIVAPFFFIIFFVFANYILLNLFVAVILENFEIKEEEKQEEQRKKYLDEEKRRSRRRRKRKSTMGVSRSTMELDPGRMTPVSRSPTPVERPRDGSAEGSDFLSVSFARPTVTSGMEEATGGKGRKEKASCMTALCGCMCLPKHDKKVKKAGGDRKGMTKKSTNAFAMAGWVSDLDAGRISPSPSMHFDDQDVQMVEEDVDDPILCGISLSNPFRRFCLAVVNHVWFDRIIMFIIAVSALLLALEGPPEMGNPERDYSDPFLIIDLVFLFIFFVEFCLKIMANGVFYSESAYFKDGYNRLDFFVLVVSVLDLLLSASTTGAGRALRVLRALRPLRVLSRNEGMRMIVDSIIRSMPAIFYVVVLSVFIFLIFSIIGVGLFSGKFYFCNDSNASGKSDCEGLVQDEYGVYTPQIWANPTYSFDNALYGLLTLFEVSTLEGWLDVLHSAMDTTEVDKQPVKDSNWTSAFYFVIFIIVASFFILQLFIGVFTDNFNRFRGTALLTEGQRAWVDLQRMMLHMKPLKFIRIPKDAFSKKVFDIVQHKAFEGFILICIVVNVLFMMTEHYGQPEDWTFVLEISNYVFLAIFFFEMVMKLIAYRPKQYFSDSWNVFDFAIVMGSIVAVAIQLATGSRSVAIGFARVFRIGRVIRIVKKAEGLRFIFNTLVISLPSFANVAVLFFLLLYIYAVMGVQMFGNVKFQQYLNRHANFRSFPNGLLILFRTVTGENWQAIMHDCQISLPHCTENDEITDCGQPLLAVLYFLSFYVFAAFMFLNLIIGLVLDNF
eukprot:TRINITY_DN16303_c0_g1_i1.p1 TRINITY_DN16303_c0_g1~~TRINITY_DN16303_c0_g1_i1.p1  ORF type:complete len:988 (+),score=249.52 TRINITY_DN16303_c0_g1_i1:350-3313(+)